MSVTLITGANGFLAGHFVQRLRSDGSARIVGLDVSPPTADADLDEFVSADITDAGSISAAIGRARPDRIFHLAGLMGSDTDRLKQVNEVGTINLLNALLNVARDAEVLVTGSAAEYGPRALGAPSIREDDECSPRDAYGITKLAATKRAQEFAREHGLRVVIVRPFNIIGAGMRDSLVVGALVSRAVAATKEGGSELSVGNLDAQRDFIDVADVAAGCIAALNGGAGGEIYNLCSGKAVTIRDVAGRIIEMSGRNLKLRIDPALDRGADASLGSPEKAKRAFQFRTRIPLEQSLSDIWNFAVSEGERCASRS
jgi:GDP-4-dehydro-6-deoxy-D-mannose reductase